METVSVFPKISIEIFNEVRKYKSCFAKKSKDHLSNIREIFRGSLFQKESFLTSIGKNVSSETLPRTLCSAFSNTIGKINLEKMQDIYIKNKGKCFKNEKTFLFIDGGDINKKYSPIEPFSKEEDFGNSYKRKNDKNYPLEKVCGNIDGSEGHIVGKGYYLENIVGYGETSKQIHPLHLHLYSTQEKEYKSAFDEQKKGLKKITKNLPPSSFDRVVVEDRGGDDISKYAWYFGHELYTESKAEQRIRDLKESTMPEKEKGSQKEKENLAKFSFLTRMNSHWRSRKMIEEETGELISVADIAGRAKRDKQLGAERKWKNKHAKNPKYKNKEITSQIGYTTVFLKEFPQIPLTLIYVWSDVYEEPLLLLTDQKVFSKKKAWDYFFVYTKRWEAEKMYRELKTNFGLEKIRVRSLAKQKTFAFLLMMVWSFSKKLHQKKKEILGFGIRVFNTFLKRNQKKNIPISFLSFLREKIQPLSETYSHRNFSQHFSVLRLPPNDSQLSFFPRSRMS